MYAIRSYYASPHPEGNGAFDAMVKALDDAGITPEQIDYISLHGTGRITSYNVCYTKLLRINIEMTQCKI